MKEVFQSGEKSVGTGFLGKYERKNENGFSNMDNKKAIRRWLHDLTVILMKSYLVLVRIWYWGPAIGTNGTLEVCTATFAGVMPKHSCIFLLLYTLLFCPLFVFSDLIGLQVVTDVGP